MEKLMQGSTGFFTKDGQQGQIVAVFNGGMFGTFRSDNGAEFTVCAHEFEQEVDTQAPGGHEDSVQAAAVAQINRYSEIAKAAHVAGTQRKEVGPARVIARIEMPPHRHVRSA